MARSPARLLVLAAPMALLVSCVLAQDLGSTGNETGPDAQGGVNADAGSPSNDAAPSTTDANGVDARDGSTVPGPNGPGLLGALPSGYCCSKDEECRFRHCADTGGGVTMCLDECSASRPALCTRPGFTFTCQSGTGGEYCQPPAGFACIPAETYARGTKTTGGCCADTTDGLTGQECEANLCLAVGTSPWFCTRRCTVPGDCPSDYRCVPVGDRSECIPKVIPYTCQ